MKRIVGYIIAYIYIYMRVLYVYYDVISYYNYIINILYSVVLCCVMLCYVYIYIYMYIYIYIVSRMIFESAWKWDVYLKWPLNNGEKNDFLHQIWEHPIWENTKHT